MIHKQSTCVRGLRTFAFDAENAENLFLKKLDKKLFERRVSAKLREAAKESVDEYTVNDIKDLLKHLKKHFLNGRDFKFYPQELTRVTMLPDEIVFQCKEIRKYKMLIKIHQYC